MHDLIAELEGYRNELSSAERHGDEARAEAVRAEVARVAEAVNARVDQLLADADAADEELQDLTAAQKRGEARRMALALPERLRGGDARKLAGDGQSGSSDTADHTPTETATPGKQRISRGDRPAPAKTGS